MFKPNYDLIGSIPEVESYRGEMSKLIAEYRDITIKPMQKMAIGIVIEMCAQHFYGIDLQEVESMSDLIELVQSIDQQLEFA